MKIFFFEIGIKLKMLKHGSRVGISMLFLCGCGRIYTCLNSGMDTSCTPLEHASANLLQGGPDNTFFRLFSF